MKRKMLNFVSGRALCLAALLALLASGALAQTARPASPAPAAGTPGPEVTLAGVVKSAAGQPVQGAEVILCDKGRTAYAFSGSGKDGLLKSRQDLAAEKKATTGADGKFELKTNAKVFTLVASSADGASVLCEDQFKSGDTITLPALSKLEGVVKEGAKPRPGAKIQIQYTVRTKAPQTVAELYATPQVALLYTATTDDQGRFTVDKIMPGQVKISAMTDAGAGRIFPGPLTSLELKPGATGQIQIGGQGRPVIGKIALKAGSEPYTAWDSCQVILRPAPAKIPEAVSKQGREAVIQWQKNYDASPEGQAQAKIKDYAQRLVAKSDGTFIIQDVPAGQYTLVVGAFPPPQPAAAGQPPRPSSGIPLAQAAKPFAVPAMPGGRSDEPLDIKEVTLFIPKEMKPGVEAPDWKSKTLEGQALSLKETRGKYVLLDFWATWCGPCKAELPFLRKAYEEFGKDPRFVMISLSLDNTLAEPTEFVKTNDMKWTQVYLGKWKDAEDVTDQYGVNGIPATFLLGPDGKIITTELRGEHLHENLAKALGK